MTFYVGDYVKIHAPTKVTGVFMSSSQFALVKAHDKEVALVVDVSAGSPDIAITIDGETLIVLPAECLELVHRVSRPDTVPNPIPEPIVVPETAPEPTPKPVERISKTDYYLGIAKAVSLRSTCLRRRYGAVIVKNDEIIATGYNGAPRGEQNCCDTGECYRQRMGIPHGEQYEKCVSVHAEQNAIISASRSEMIGATLYLYGWDVETGKSIDAAPCLICDRLIRNAGIADVVTSKEGE